MAQLFKRRANALAKLTLVGVPLLIAGASVTLFAFARSDFWTRVDVPLEQPVPFSHKPARGVAAFPPSSGRKEGKFLRTSSFKKIEKKLACGVVI